MNLLPKRLAVFIFCLSGFRFDAQDVRNAWFNTRVIECGWRGVWELWRR